MTVVLGVDLSLTGTGCVSDSECGAVLVTKPVDTIERRLIAIRDFVLDHAAGADLTVVEDYVTRSPAASSLALIHGVVRVALVEAGRPFTLVPPATLKKYAAGKGNATKADMRVALYKRTGLDWDDDNLVDAWWLRAAGWQILDRPVVDVPMLQKLALAKIAMAA